MSQKKWAVLDETNAKIWSANPANPKQKPADAFANVKFNVGWQALEHSRLPYIQLSVQPTTSNTTMASLSRSTANRAVHLLITPRPSNISDSREILRLVSQFGEVEYYKNLKYDTLSHPSASLVIFRDEKAAESCLKRSPIRFRLGPAPAANVEDQPHPQQHSHNTPTPAAATPPQQPQNHSPLPPNSSKGPVSSPFGMSQSRSLSTHSLPTAPRTTPALPFLHADPSPNAHTQTSRIFQLQTNPARTNFRDQVDRAEYHGRFMIDTKSAIQQDLAKRVPTLGLSAWEWRKPEKPDRVVQKMRGGERGRSLMEIWEEGRGIDGV